MRPPTRRDPDARFRTLVQSPLRAGLLRYLSARPDESFDVESLMQTFGRLRLDVENCVRELVDFGVARDVPGRRRRATRPTRPADEALADLLDHFLERRATVSTEDQSPSVQRFREMIGRDEKMLIVFEWIRTAAKSDISVLILGPTGSGKEVVARMIHELSRRSGAKFQAVNCAALPDTLFESEIFGYEKGAFTGAHDRKPGRLELANDGTLFLDEIGDLSLIAQAKLLRVLEERRFERLGGNKSISVDFRLISATNRPLEQFVRDGRFREDLYYRVNAFAIRLPSLRERQVDIPVLAQRFLTRYCAAQGLPLDSKAFSREALDLLARLPRGPATSASSKARCRAPRCRRRAGSIRADRHRVPARDRRRRRSRRATACRRSPRPSARTSSACSRRSSGTRRRPRGCSTSAAARCTGRSSSTGSSPSRGRPAVERARRRTPESRCRAHAPGDGGFHGLIRRAWPVGPVLMKDLPIAARLYVGAVLRRRRRRLLGLFAPRTLAEPGPLRRPARSARRSRPRSRSACRSPRSGSTMSVSYAVDFASLLLLGANETMIVAAASAWSQCTFRMTGAQPAATARCSAWRRSCSP